MLKNTRGDSIFTALKYYLHQLLCLTCLPMQTYGISVPLDCEDDQQMTRYKSAQQLKFIDYFLVCHKKGRTTTIFIEIVILMQLRVIRYIYLPGAFICFFVVQYYFHRAVFSSLLCVVLLQKETNNPYNFISQYYLHTVLY